MGNQQGEVLQSYNGTSLRVKLLFFSLYFLPVHLGTAHILPDTVCCHVSIGGEVNSRELGPSVGNLA